MMKNDEGERMKDEGCTSFVSDGLTDYVDKSKCLYLFIMCKVIEIKNTIFKPA